MDPSKIERFSRMAGKRPEVGIAIDFMRKSPDLRTHAYRPGSDLPGDELPVLKPLRETDRKGVGGTVNWSV